MLHGVCAELLAQMLDVLHFAAATGLLLADATLALASHERTFQSFAVVREAPLLLALALGLEFDAHAQQGFFRNAAAVVLLLAGVFECGFCAAELLAQLMYRVPPAAVRLLDAGDWEQLVLVRVPLLFLLCLLGLLRVAERLHLLHLSDDDDPEPEPEPHASLVQQAALALAVLAQLIVAALVVLNLTAVGVQLWLQTDSRHALLAFALPQAARLHQCSAAVRARVLLLLALAYCVSAAALHAEVARVGLVADWLDAGAYAALVTDGASAPLAATHALRPMSLDAQQFFAQGSLLSHALGLALVVVAGALLGVQPAALAARKEKGV